MLHSINTPKGIDLQIDNLQNWLFADLKKLGWNDYECYPRAYILPNPRLSANVKNRGTNRAEFNSVSISLNNKDYAIAIPDDSHAATSICVVKSMKPNGYDLATSEVAIIFYINLKLLYPAATDNMSEQAINDVLKSLKYNSALFKMTKVNRALRDIYDTFNVKINDTESIGDYFTFSIDLQVNYENEFD